MGLILQPITFAEAAEFIRQHHRHHVPSVSHKFSIAASCEGEVVAVVVVGRPVSRMLDDGWTAEVTRLASDGTRNACSMLYRAAWRAARAMGYRRLITYILDTELGTTLTAAGFKCLGQAGGGEWSRASRPRVDLHPTQGKIRWEVS